VDLARSEITLRHCKGDREERVFTPRAVAAEMAAWIAGRIGRLCDLCHRHAHRRLRGWLANAGITRAAGPHALRRSFATSLCARTHDLLLVQRALRHQNIASTMVYAHLDDGRVREAL
jgi:site-specific recombinase XerC